MAPAAFTILALVTLQHLGERVLDRRNAERLLRQGVEVGAEHHASLLMMQAAWLLGLWLLASGRAVLPEWLAVYLVLQTAKLWVIGSLGPAWTTRTILAPNRRAPGGLSHAHEAVAAAEIAVLPLAFGLPGVAIMFSALNAVILVNRFRAERAALAQPRRRR